MTDRVDVRYRIDANDCISFADDAWDDVVHREDVPQLASNRIMGRTLWEFVSDDTTRLLYRQILARVRAGRAAQFQIRCDGPDVRRVLELTIRTLPASADSVEFLTRTVQSTARSRVALLDHTVSRSDEVVRACAWCNRIEVRGGSWLEVEDATHRLRLFEQAAPPRLSHGMCAACSTDMALKLESLT